MNRAFDTVNRFEEVIADYAGARYGVAIDSCTNALFLCCKYLKVKNVTLPKYTYPGVACAVIHAGGKVSFNDLDWKGVYSLYPYPIYDSALRFQRYMYSSLKGSFYCLSFHAKKHLPIGRGGMILTDDKEAVKWFKKARFDGRGEMPLDEDNLTMLGWNCYMTPEQAARGFVLFEALRNKNLSDMITSEQHYPDLSKSEAYK